MFIFGVGFSWSAKDKTYESILLNGKKFIVMFKFTAQREPWFKRILNAEYMRTKRHTFHDKEWKNTHKFPSVNMKHGMGKSGRKNMPAVSIPKGFRSRLKTAKSMFTLIFDHFIKYAKRFLSLLAFFTRKWIWCGEPFLYAKTQIFTSFSAN